MGGVTVLLAGDFQQTLPVVPRGTRADEVKAYVKLSHLWPSVTKLSLTTNMRVHLRGDVTAGQFSDLWLKIRNDDFPELDYNIILPTELGTIVSTVEELINIIYPNINNNHDKLAEWLCERAILTPKTNKYMKYF
ncbi:unnamed protein product [Parnassius mnemosyne]|uniref:ATP-dependent DNA helicase n=1 Tax=Parnassius mnemosyne TaxID=213953 RepID=A0AAV1L0H6_9NEOP